MSSLHLLADISCMLLENNKISSKTSVFEDFGNIILKLNSRNPWIQKIDISKEIDIKEFDSKSEFKKVCDIVLDDSTKRQSVIIPKPCVSKEEWKRNDTVIYIFTINNKIVKIDGSRNGLESRFTSYLSGHHTKSRGKSGKCSSTNAVVYNTLEYYLKCGNSVQMYCKVLPNTVQTYESVYIKKYKEKTGRNPCMSNDVIVNYF